MYSSPMQFQIENDALHDLPMNETLQEGNRMPNVLNGVCKTR